MYVFLDLETTGLDPEKDHILQLAMVVTSDDLDPIGEHFCSDVALTEAAAGRLYMNPFVRDMHRKTGLLDRLEDVVPPYPCEAAEGAAIKFLRKYAGADRVRGFFTIAGNSVHFDLAFLRVHMPRLAAMFSHRIMDVSVLRMFEDRYGSGAIDVVNDCEHDALADCRCAIRQLHAYVERRKSL